MSDTINLSQDDSHDFLFESAAKEREFLEVHIDHLNQYLKQQQSLSHISTSSAQAADSLLAVSYRDPNFTTIAKDRLLAVIIGGLLLLLASRLIYEK